MIEFCHLCKKGHEFCDTCGAGIGEKHLEPYANTVGEYSLCGNCFQFLKTYGLIELPGTGKLLSYLLPDGSTRQMTPIEASKARKKWKKNEAKRK